MASINETHVIVVGGGVAGLSAAAYLARDGLSVSVLEKARELGGRAATDTPHGFALNRGVHALYSGGAASEVLRELGVRYTSASPKGILALDGEGLHAFPATAAGILFTDLLEPSDKAELVGIFWRLSTLRSTTLASVSIADWITATARRPKVRQLLSAIARVYAYSAALDLVSADLFVSRLQQTVKHPVHYIDGGWRTLVGALRSVTVGLGVRILTSASVAEVQLEDGLARGVRLHDGTELSCSQLVLAVPPEDALRVMGSQPHSQLQRSAGASVPAVIACLDLALTSLPKPAHPVVFNLEEPLFMTAQSQFARLAPAGGAVIHAFKQLDPRLPSRPHEDRADLESFMDRLQPGWQAVAVERRFLPRMVAAGTLPLVSTGGLGGRAGYRSEDAVNVYFAGDWVGPRGFLIDASLDSAREAARLILNDAALRPHALVETPAAA